MGWIVKQLTGPFSTYILIAMGVILLGLSLTTSFLWHNNGALRDDLATQKAAVQSLTSANVSNQDAIRQLTAANQQWATLNKTHKAQEAEAAKKAETFEIQLAAANQATADAVRREHQELNCATLMAMDIQRVCPATAKRMRDDATRPD